ncbi:MAG: c-type cytochrome domain-containing protein [Pseudomonadota bacterium]|nr:c-type cytochrome domain-containing protein [Pseudomonadota bacterium]
MLVNLHKYLKLIPFLALLVLAVGMGCSSSHDEDEGFSLVEPRFKSITENIFVSKCVHCHGPQKSEKGIDLSSYEKIFSGAVFPPLIIPGNPEKSSLYKSVAEGKMPKNEPSLNKKELKAIYKWIKNGAKKEETPDSDPLPLPSPTEPETDEPGTGTDEPGSSTPIVESFENSQKFLSFLTKP